VDHASDVGVVGAEVPGAGDEQIRIPPIYLDLGDEKEVRRVAHGPVWFPSPVECRILDLMKLQCSATRSAYQAVHKKGLSGNDVKKYVKKNYMKGLNQRYVSDACSKASQLKKPGVVFGGKKVWRGLQSGNISKREWWGRRNSQLYSQGDRTKRGNPNIRVMVDRLLVNDPTGRGLWLEGKLFLPSKWTLDLSCYEVRLLYKAGKFLVKISWDEALPKELSFTEAVGIDTNPDGVGVSVVSADGNLLSHAYLRSQRIQFASTNKRDNDIRVLAKEVVGKAWGGAIVLESLDFKPKKGSKKFNRMKSNFIHRKLREAIRSRALRRGVPVIEVNPAFTSILGNFKYSKMYSLNRHTAAALVIARRGLGIQERQNFTVTPKGRDGEKWNLEGRSFSHTLSSKACSWLMDCFVRGPKPTGLTAPGLAPGLKPGICPSLGETPKGKSSSTTGRRGRYLLLGDERHP
jgi:IS605 OrfB family transposase